MLVLILTLLLRRRRKISVRRRRHDVQRYSYGNPFPLIFVLFSGARLTSAFLFSLERRYGVSLSLFLSDPLLWRDLVNQFIDIVILFVIRRRDEERSSATALGHSTAEKARQTRSI